MAPQTCYLLLALLEMVVGVIAHVSRDVWEDTSPHVITCLLLLTAGDTLCAVAKRSPCLYHVHGICAYIRHGLVVRSLPNLARLRSLKHDDVITVNWGTHLWQWCTLLVCEAF